VPKAVLVALVFVAAVPPSTAIGNHAEDGSWLLFHMAMDGLILVATAIFVAIGASHLAGEQGEGQPAEEAAQARGGLIRLCPTYIML